MHRLDEDSLKAVELTAPGACETEAQRLYGRIRSGEIFRAFDEQERMNLWERLCSASTDCLVPSLFAYFENLKYLQVAANCMRRLVHLEKNETIRSALEDSYSDRSNNTCLVQSSAASFREISADGIDQFDLVYRQLWLFALREDQNIPAEPKKKLAGPKGGKADENVLFSFASLADKLGVSSREITELLQRDPDREMARRFLTTARRPEDYAYVQHDIIALTPERTPVYLSLQFGHRVHYAGLYLPLLGSLRWSACHLVQHDTFAMIRRGTSSRLGNSRRWQGNHALV